MSAFKQVRPWVFTSLVQVESKTVIVERTPEAQRSAEQERMAELLPTLPSLEEIRSDAHAEGFADGHARGLSQVRETHRRGTRRLLRLTRNAVAEADELTRRLEREVVDLSLAIAEKIVEHELHTSPEIVVNTVRAALKEMDRSAIVKVRVHPEDHSLLTSHWGELIPLPLDERARLIPDADIERGGCIIETRSGLADAQPHAKLAQIAQLFDALLAGEIV